MSWLTQVFDFLRSKLAPLSLSIDLAPHDEGAPTKIHYILRYHKIVVIIKKKNTRTNLPNNIWKITFIQA